MCFHTQVCVNPFLGDSFFPVRTILWLIRYSRFNRCVELRLTGLLPKLNVMPV